MKTLIIFLLIGCCRVNPALAQSPIRDSYDILKVCLSEGFGPLSLRGPLERKVFPVDTLLMVSSLDSADMRRSFFPIVEADTLQWPTPGLLQSMESFLYHTKTDTCFNEEELNKRELVLLDRVADRKDLAYLPIFRASFPLISSNRQYALIYGEYSCEWDCSEGILFLLRSVNNRWIIIAQAEVWQS